MSHFVLVHGAWHDGRCWAPLVGELERREHGVTAVDLPSDRPGLGALDYARVVEAAVPATGETCVLVGHSLGGLTVPVAAAHLGPARVAAMVLVAPLLPEPGRSWADQVRAGVGVMADGVGRTARRHDDGTTSWSAPVAATDLYGGVAQEASPEVVDAAVAGLRPQAWDVGREVTPLTRWPAVPTTVVVCAEDRVVVPSRLRDRAATVPGVRLVELPGGHFPMLTRPADLAAVLTGAAGPGALRSRTAR